MVTTAQAQQQLQSAQRQLQEQKRRLEQQRKQVEQTRLQLTKAQLLRQTPATAIRQKAQRRLLERQKKQALAQLTEQEKKVSKYEKEVISPYAQQVKKATQFEHDLKKARQIADAPPGGFAAWALENPQQKRLFKMLREHRASYEELKEYREMMKELEAQQLPEITEQVFGPVQQFPEVPESRAYWDPEKEMVVYEMVEFKMPETGQPSLYRPEELKYATGQLGGPGQIYDPEAIKKFQEETFGIDRPLPTFKDIDIRRLREPIRQLVPKVFGPPDRLREPLPEYGAPVFTAEEIKRMERKFLGVPLVRYDTKKFVVAPTPEIAIAEEIPMVERPPTKREKRRLEREEYLKFVLETPYKELIREGEIPATVQKAFFDAGKWYIQTIDIGTSKVIGTRRMTEEEAERWGVTFGALFMGAAFAPAFQAGVMTKEKAKQLLKLKQITKAQYDEIIGSLARMEKQLHLMKTRSKQQSFLSAQRAKITTPEGRAAFDAWVKHLEDIQVLKPEIVKIPKVIPEEISVTTAPLPTIEYAGEIVGGLAGLKPEEVGEIAGLKPEKVGEIVGVRPEAILEPVWVKEEPKIIQLPKDEEKVVEVLKEEVVVTQIPFLTELSEEALKELEKQRRKQIAAFAQPQPQVPKLIQPQPTIQFQPPAYPTPRPIPRPTPRPIPKPKPKPKPRPRPIPRIIIPITRKRKPKKRVYPELKEEVPEQGYTFEVRRKGKWERAKLPFAFATKKGAEAIAQERVLKEAAASYKIVKARKGKKVVRTGKKVSPYRDVLFRPGKSGAMVQKKLLRILTPGEKKEISYKGALARMKKAKLKFGSKTHGLKPKKKSKPRKKKGGRK